MNRLMQWMKNLSPIGSTATSNRRATREPFVAPTQRSAQTRHNGKRNKEKQPLRVCVRRYKSLIELRSWLEALEDAQDVTLVVALAANFAGDLRSLIRREQPAMRLVLASALGRLPGLTTIGDLDMASAALGWQTITFEPQVTDAIEGVIHSSNESEPVLVFVPEWEEPKTAQHILNAVA